MQDAEGDCRGERKKGRWLLNSGGPCWDAQAERGSSALRHWGTAPWQEACASVGSLPQEALSAS